MRVAAVDCGTNTIRLLIADLDPSTGQQADVDRQLRYVRLGQGVDRTGRLADEAMSRTLEAAEDYAARCRTHGAARIRIGATSAVRDAANADEFLDEMTERLGARPEVLAGSEEASLSWLGAMRDLAAADLPKDQLVVDIGGGSTEVIRGAGNSIAGARSLDIGSVRLTERHLTADPPTEEQIAAAAADADAAFDAVTVRDGIDLAAVGSVVGVAGSITTIAAHTLALDSYDSNRIHHARLPIDDVIASCATLLATPVDARRAMPFMPSGRADVIGGGAVVLGRLLLRLAPTLRLPYLVVSEHDFLDGLAWSAAEPNTEAPESS
jgi:exopolyphosphatase / guanosine-5'-triphosphate,3'-diphosphate pyrophosphatase